MKFIAVTTTLSLLLCFVLAPSNAFITNPMTFSHCRKILNSDDLSQLQNKMTPQPTRLNRLHRLEVSTSSSQIATDFAREILPKQDKFGVSNLKSKDDHISFLENNPDQIVVVKFFAPWCRACKGLAPKYVQLAKDPRYSNLPIKFAQLSIQNNKEYIKSLGIQNLPAVQIYAATEDGLELVENFTGGPNKVMILRKKIAQVINGWVDPETYKMKQFRLN